MNANIVAALFEAFAFNRAFTPVFFWKGVPFIQDRRDFIRSVQDWILENELRYTVFQ